MYEIPEILLFVCVLLLIGIGATTSVVWKWLFALAYYACAIGVIIIGLGMSYLATGVTVASGVLLVWLLALKWASHRGVLRREASMGADDAHLETSKSETA